MKKIWGNTIVKNEDRFIWYAISSVIEYLDRMIIYDTGSSDNTVEIIKILQKKYPEKIDFKIFPAKDTNDITKLRQKMLEETKSDWLLIVDGDEIWWEKSIVKVVDFVQIKGENFYGFVIPVINLVGDIYHHLADDTGKYKIKNKIGHYNIRAVNRNIQGLHVKNSYPLEGYYDSQGRIIQEVEDKTSFIDAPILHLTHLKRSSLKNGDKAVLGRIRKMKYEIGERFPEDFKYPEVLYYARPNIVPSPWAKMSQIYKLIASIQTPIRRFKRKLIK